MKTKKPKKVKLKKVPVVHKYEKIYYDCPSCHVGFELNGGLLTHRITRFKCDCGQELIVEGE